MTPTESAALERRLLSIGRKPEELAVSVFGKPVAFADVRPEDIRWLNLRLEKWERAKKGRRR